MEMFKMRQSQLDREDQLEDLEQWDSFLHQQSDILFKRIAEAARIYDEHMSHMEAREVFRQKLKESLK